LAQLALASASKMLQEAIFRMALEFFAR